MAKVGRPTKYKKEYAEQAYKLCLLGAIDKDMADFFDTSEQTINAWKKEYPEFFESIKRGKIEADSVIAQKLFHRAKGYEHAEDKIFQYEGEPIIVPTIRHYPPDTTAAIFWLKNRQPAQWRDRQEIEQTNRNTNINIDAEKLSDGELQQQMQQLAKEILEKK